MACRGTNETLIMLSASILALSISVACFAVPDKVMTFLNYLSLKKAERLKTKPNSVNTSDIKILGFMMIMSGVFLITVTFWIQ